MRVLLFLAIFLGGCAAAGFDPYEAACGSANGYFFKEGEKIPPNIEKEYLANVPLEALECRALEGDYYAQYNLGVLYLEGKRVEQDYRKASDLFFAAGRTTKAEYQYYNARFGAGPFNSFIDANTKRQRTLGFAPAQYALGLMYYSGLNGKKDVEEALFWMEKAARLGNQEAQDFLAKIEVE